MVSDHGENLMEHTQFQKHWMFESAIGVPLVIACPGAAGAGTVNRTITGLVDLFPTLLDMTGIAHPDSLEGQSLAPLLRDGIEDPDRVTFSEYYPGSYPAERMIRSGPWKYIYAHGDVAQLYHMEDDPDEMHNLAAESAHREFCDELRARVMEGWEIDTFTYTGENEAMGR